MSKHMSLIETLQWSTAHGFTINIFSLEDGLVVEIDDADNKIPNAELHCSWEEVDQLEKTLAGVMSDLYFEKEGIK